VPSRLLRYFLWLTVGAIAFAQSPSSPSPVAPGARVLLDAHNCYPDADRWADRLERALATGVPIAIEQDLVWYKAPSTGRARSIVSHGEPFTGREPSLESHFFERIRPIVTKALAEPRRETWPLIVLNLDLKTNEPEHHRALWDTLTKYESWLTKAERTGHPTRVMPLTVGPVLVLTGNPDAQQAAFHDAIPTGGKLLLFGALRVDLEPKIGRGREAVPKMASLSAEDLIPSPATNYRRWVNFPWAVVERGGQGEAGPWTPADDARLRSLVDRAHRSGYWIRFYTLNGHTEAESKGWTASYNFGSIDSARERFRAAISAGVDFIATDQYEELSAVLGTLPTAAQRAAGWPAQGQPNGRADQGAAALAAEGGQRQTKWYKGNTHTHTLNSDGDSTPDEVARWYREHGYQFLVLSDHNFLTSVDGLNALHGADERFLLIRGEEVTDAFAGKPIHVNGLALDRLVTPQGGASILDTIQRNVDAIRSVNGVPHINHPNFRWAITADELTQVRNNKLFEVFNGHPQVNNAGGGGVPGLEAVWDQILSSGQMVYGIAVDDAHHFKRPWDPAASRPGQGWVVVRAPRLEAREIVLALERGDFYASTGVTIKDISATATSLSITVDPTPYSKYRVQFIGKGGALLAEQTTNPATYAFRGGEGYVRAKVLESNGELAWIQPVAPGR
jgi:hypothetical protein